jgi:hypothetical protein
VAYESGHTVLPQWSNGFALGRQLEAQVNQVFNFSTVIDRRAFSTRPWFLYCTVIGLSRMTLRTIGGSASGTWLDPVLWKRTRVADGRVECHSTVPRAPTS